MEYEGVTVHEMPPNGQGLTTLIALNILSELDGVDMKSLGHNTAEYLHLVQCSLTRVGDDTFEMDLRYRYMWGFLSYVS